MEHLEYWLVVDGAYEAEIITDPDGKVLINGDAGSAPSSVDEWLDLLEEEAASHSGHWQVFVIHHGDHELSEPCECAQYEQSHLPIWEREEQAQ